jgi:hypothetical protein
MAEMRVIESGRMGRVAYARIAPNEDLVSSVEKLCLAEGFGHAFVRGALGSLVDACLERADGSCQVIRGPAAEIVSLAGEVRSNSVTPSSSSISLIARLTGGCDRFRRCAARPKCSSSATAIRQRRWRISIDLNFVLIDTNSKFVAIDVNF